MKSTPLTEVHIGLGAKMAEFAGYNMPIVYTTISDEHENVRQKVGVFDVSHMGEFIVKGKEATAFVQSVTSNNVHKLEIGDAQYSCMPNDNGGIVDDLLVYRLSEDQCSEGEQAYMLVVNASNIDKDWNWLESKNTFEAKMHNISDKTGLLAVQGPDAVKLVQKLTDFDTSTLSYYTFTKTTIAGIDNVLLSATGYTGSGGFELYVESDNLLALWNAVMDAGKEFDIKPAGLGARDTLRLEMGFCLYGNDINDTTSPLEAGLGWITKLKVEEDFSSKSIFVKQRAEGISKKLVAFTVDGKRVPRQHYSIHDMEENEIGEVTSGTQSPSLGYPIGMGYIPKEMAKVGNTIKVKFGKKFLEAEIVKLPFYKVNA
ncbi:MAG: glycine cleavage system aminomethyltransferase GcvT [Saprospiraceae bacterium]|nr:glycine cleavage system aminomethyltransferase GcvT [Saprospiraceae bacterium]